LMITSISILANPFSIIGSYLQSANRKFRQTPTSSPITKTLESADISSSIAELRASLTVICAPHTTLLSQLMQFCQTFAEWLHLSPYFSFRSRITDERHTSLLVDINLLEAAQAIAAALSLLRLWRKQTTLKSVPRKYPALSQDISHLSLALSWKKNTSSLKKDGMRAW
jgi:hypothetical protein